jgi:hypothetical protein
MADQQTTTERDATADPGPAPPLPGKSSPSAAGADDAFAERPEAFVGAAFAGGLALALILKRIAR